MKRRALLVAGVLVAGVAVLLLPGGGGPAPSVRPSPPPGSRALMVLDADGRPVAEASVEVHVSSPYRLEPRRHETVVSDEEGRAFLPPLGVSKEEQVVVVVRGPGFAVETFPVGAETEAVHLSPGIEAKGLVLDLAGRPVAGARVVSPPGPPFVVETRTDAAGRFYVGPVAEDAWIRAEADGYAPLELNPALYPEKDRELVFPLVRERRVEGRVVDGRGKGISGAIVTLDQEAVSRFRTDDEGRFELRGVLTDWEVFVTAGKKGLVGSTVAAVAGQRDLRLSLHRPAEIRGRVEEGGTGRPIPEFEILRREPQRLEAGGFLLTDLVPGEVSIEVRSGFLVGRVTVEVREGDIRTGVVVPLFPERWGPGQDYRPAYAVEVIALGEDTGTPLPGVRLTGSGAGRETRTDRDGRAVIAFPPGRHRLRAGGSFEPYAPEEREFYVPEESRLEFRLARNSPAVLELLDGSAPPESKVWLHRGAEVVEAGIRGTTHDFLAPRDEPFDIVLKAKSYFPETVRGILLPDDGRIPVRLYEGPMIAGRCVGAGGHPLPKVVAEVAEAPLDARMETLGDGCFRVGPLKPGRYTLLLYARNIRTRTLDVEVPEEGVDLGDVEMQPPGDLHVLVLTSDRRPLAGAVAETSLFVAATGMTDGAGRVILPHKNPEEVLRVRAEGYLDAWQEVRIFEDRETAEAVVTMVRPARILVRTVDEEGHTVAALPPTDGDIRRVRPGEFLVENLPPGRIEMVFRDVEGRKGLLEVFVLEGESRVVTLRLE